MKFYNLCVFLLLSSVIFGCANSSYNYVKKYGRYFYDEYGVVMKDDQVKQLEKNVKALARCIDRKRGDDEVVKTIKSLKYRQEAFTTIHPSYVSRLFLQVKNIDKVFTKTLKPKTLYHLYYYAIGHWALHRRRGRYPKLTSTLNRYLNGEIDGEGDLNPDFARNKKLTTEAVPTTKPFTSSKSPATTTQSVKRPSYIYVRKYGRYIFDEYGKAMNDAQVNQLENDVNAMIRVIHERRSDKEVIKTMESLTFREEAFMMLPSGYVPQLFMQVKSIDKVFTILKPRTLYYLYYYTIGYRALSVRQGQYPEFLSILNRYLKGEIDGEGNAKSGFDKNNNPTTGAVPTPKPSAATTTAPKVTTTESVTGASYNYVNKYGRYFYDEYGNVMNDGQVRQFEEDVQVMVYAIFEKRNDDEILRAIKSLTFREETLVSLPPGYASQLFLQVQNIDKVFTILKPKTLYYLYHKGIDARALSARQGQYPQFLIILNRYMNGEIDGEGNSNRGRSPSGCDPNGCQPNPCYPGKCNPSKPANPGPLNEHYRLLLFKTIPNLHPNLINALPELHWSFTEYILTNAKYPSQIVNRMYHNTLRWVVEHVPNFGGLLATMDKMTIMNTFRKIPFPCDFYRSLNERVRYQLSFKYNWLYQCEPTTTTTTTTTTAAPTTTTTEKFTSPHSKPIFDLETLTLITEKVPDFGVLFNLIELNKFNRDNKAAVELVELIKKLSDEDAKRANALFNQLKPKMTKAEVVGILLNSLNEFSGALLIVELFYS